MFDFFFLGYFEELNFLYVDFLLRSFWIVFVIMGFYVNKYFEMCLFYWKLDYICCMCRMNEKYYFFVSLHHWFEMIEWLSGMFYDIFFMCDLCF